MPLRAGLLVLAVLVAGCRRADRASGPAAPRPDSAAVALARAVADSLGDELMDLLSRALDRGGPALAIQFCADSAQARTLRHWRNGLYIRRVSERVRNARDTPDAIERRLLARLAEAYRAGNGDPAGFLPEVKELLARRYPNDRATGYAVGDLRGAVSVRVPLGTPGRH